MIYFKSYHLPVFVVCVARFLINTLKRTLPFSAAFVWTTVVWLFCYQKTNYMLGFFSFKMETSGVAFSLLLSCIYTLLLSLFFFFSEKKDFRISYVSDHPSFSFCFIYHLNLCPSRRY